MTDPGFRRGRALAFALGLLAFTGCALPANAGPPAQQCVSIDLAQESLAASGYRLVGTMPVPADAPSAKSWSLALLFVGPEGDGVLVLAARTCVSDPVHLSPAAMRKAVQMMLGTPA